jgi:hypothetical protein
MPQQWKESVIVPIYTKGDKTDCNNYQGIFLLTTTFKILPKILLASLTLICPSNYCGLPVWVLL